MSCLENFGQPSTHYVNYHMSHVQKQDGPRYPPGRLVMGLSPVAWPEFLVSPCPYYQHNTQQQHDDDQQAYQARQMTFRDHAITPNPSRPMARIHTTN